MSDFDYAVFAIEDELATEENKNNSTVDSVNIYKTGVTGTIVAPTTVNHIEVNSYLEKKERILK